MACRNPLTCASRPVEDLQRLLQVLSWIDICAGLAAKTVARGPVVTASVDTVHFLRPCHQGSVAIIAAMVNRVFQSSMEASMRAPICMLSIITTESSPYTHISDFSVLRHMMGNCCVALSHSAFAEAAPVDGVVPQRALCC